MYVRNGSFSDTVCEDRNITHYRPRWKVRSKDVEGLDGEGCRGYQNIRNRTETPATIDLERREAEIFSGCRFNKWWSSNIGQDEMKEERLSVQFLTFKTFFLFLELCGQLPEFAHTRSYGEVENFLFDLSHVFQFQVQRGRSCETRLKDFILAESMRVVKITNSRHWHRTTNNLEKCTLSF